MESLYKWVTTEGHEGVACEECATEYGWFIPEEPTPAEARNESPRQANVPSVSRRPATRLIADDQDAFSKWVVRGIAIAIGFLIVEIPLVLIAIWWLNQQLSKLEL